MFRFSGLHKLSFYLSTVYVCVSMCMCMCVCVRACVCMHACLRACVCISSAVSVYVCVYSSILFSVFTSLCRSSTSMRSAIMYMTSYETVYSTESYDCSCVTIQPSSSEHTVHVYLSSKFHQCTYIQTWFVFCVCNSRFV